MNLPVYIPWDGTDFVPDLEKAKLAGFEAKLIPAAEDINKVLLVLVDCQKDFIIQGAPMQVQGAFRHLKI